MRRRFLVHLERTLSKGNFFCAKGKVFEKQMPHPLYLPGIMEKTNIELFFTLALYHIMPKIEAFLDKEWDIPKISTLYCPPRGAYLGNAPLLGCYPTDNVLQTTCSLQMTTRFHMLVIQFLHEN
jgi:hypothetical protein